MHIKVIIQRCMVP